MGINFASLFNVQIWRVARVIRKAMIAYDEGRFPDALRYWERAVDFEQMRSSECMAFYAILMALNKRPAIESLAMFRRVAAREFHRDHPDCHYAEALAHYWVAFLTGRSDVIERWLDAYKIRPSKGCTARLLSLPDNPIDPTERWPPIPTE